MKFNSDIYNIILSSNKNTLPVVNSKYGLSISSNSKGLIIF